MPRTTSPLRTTPLVRRLSMTSSSEESVVAKIARARLPHGLLLLLLQHEKARTRADAGRRPPRALDVTAPRRDLVEAYAHAPLLAAGDAAEHAVDRRPQPADVGDGALVVVEEREQLERDGGPPARGELHHGLVGGGARGHPLEVAQAGLERRLAVARQRRVGYDEPQPVTGVQPPHPRRPGQTPGRAREHGGARALHQAVHVRRRLVLLDHVCSPCECSCHRHLRSHRARLAAPSGGGASTGAEIIAYRRPAAERTAAARAVISRRSPAAARRQRGQWRAAESGATALIMTAPTAMRRRRRPRSRRAVSSRGSAAGRVTATTRVRAGSRMSAVSARRSRATSSRSDASSPRPTTVRYLRRMASSACTHSRAASGMANRRSAWPVGAVSSATTSYAVRSRPSTESTSESA